MARLGICAKESNDMTTILILGSGPNVVAARDWSREHIDHILAINNAFAVRPDWDSLIFPEDFPQERRPTALATGQRLVSAEDYVPAQNLYGGFVYAGGTMAFTAGYWALHAHRPRILAFMGCDLTYNGSQTHFYGKGQADPLRKDVTLQSLEAKSARLMIAAAEQGCAVVNLSHDASRLIFQKATLDTLPDAAPQPFAADLAARARRMEVCLNYFVPSGRYWLEEERFDADKLRALDALWLDAALAPAPSTRDT